MKKLLIVIAVLFSALSSHAVNYPDIKYGPWIHNVTETSFTVLWTSEQKDFAWVEVAPDDGTPFESALRQRFYYVIDGRRIADNFHSVEVSGLEPGKAYRYRIYAKVINDDSNAYGVDYGPARRVKFKGEATIRTLDRNAEKCRFFMANDIHLNDDRYKGVVKGVKASEFDFFVMNGDMASYISEADTMLRHVFHVVPSLTSSIPTVYTRGNHETRGREAHLLPKFCPTSTGKPYYLLRQGPVAMLVLDGGEDKPDEAPEYSGTVEFDKFRAEEVEWIKEVVKDPLFTEAKVKVAVIHVPALKFPDSWWGQLWLNEHMVPVLNEAGVDIMLSGHHHKHIYIKPGECGNDFPILANDEEARLEFEADNNGYHIRIFDMTGKLTNSYDKAVK